jgi:hypothetical protein
MFHTAVLADIEFEPAVAAAERLRGANRVWVVLVWGGFENRLEQGGLLKTALDADFTETARQGFARIDVRLYQRGTTTRVASPDGSS